MATRGHRTPATRSAMRTFTALAALMAGGCERIQALLEPPVPNCETRTAYYPDPDGDGVGNPGAVYLGCELPTGWTTVAPPELDTDPADSDPADSDPTDSDSADTDPADAGPPEAPPP
jgi:hypothetical protein